MEYSSYKEVQVSGEQRVCRNESEYVQDSTQDFFTNEFGLPLTTIPNFEDMSCDIFYMLVREGSFKWLPGKRCSYNEEFEEMGRPPSARNWMREGDEQEGWKQC
ncbi:uncharacterized protein LOC122277611 isoform X1 [Carya illinoinensis]|uniref:uncharacterized protein LOC122277611 isoform X1 n=1 Tax=Carya illinoinensis TaxID=32201 RepID=UPI001C72098E|nr:uncharacterized protein LOC122277611 isoform X1 [Carya illinoinensis]